MNRKKEAGYDLNLRGEVARSFADMVDDATDQSLQPLATHIICRRHLGEDSFHNLITAVEPKPLDLRIVEIAGSPTSGAGLEWAGFC